MGRSTLQLSPRPARGNDASASPPARPTTHKRRKSKVTRKVVKRQTTRVHTCMENGGATWGDGVNGDGQNT